MPSKNAFIAITLATGTLGTAAMPATSNAAASWRSVGPTLKGKVAPDRSSWRDAHVFRVGHKRYRVRSHTRLLSAGTGGVGMTPYQPNPYRKG
jgi:hypothetical protein